MTDKILPAALRQRNRELKQLTAECLTEALISLMKEYDFGDISVTRLCKKAGVSRNTFYKTFGSIGAVFRHIVLHINREVIFRRLGNPFGRSSSKDWYLRYFEIIMQYADLFRAIIRSEVAVDYMRQVNAMLVSPHLPDSVRFARYMWSGAIQNITMEWLSSGMAQSPEQMAEFCMSAGLPCS